MDKEAIGLSKVQQLFICVWPVLVSNMSWRRVIGFRVNINLESLGLVWDLYMDCIKCWLCWPGKIRADIGVFERWNGKLSTTKRLPWWSLEWYEPQVFVEVTCTLRARFIHSVDKLITRSDKVLIKFWVQSWKWIFAGHRYWIAANLQWQNEVFIRFTCNAWACWGVIVHDVLP